MKKFWILTSAVVLVAGCSSQEHNRTAYNEQHSTAYIAPTEQGAGAAAMTGNGGVNGPVYGATSPSAAGAPASGGESSGATATSGELSATDAKFIDEAARHGQAEVKMGQLIVQNSANPDVKSYGQTLVDDHTRLNQQLTQLASEKGTTLPMDVDTHHQRQLDHLGSLSCKDFDKAALKDAIRDHERDIHAFQDAAQKSQDPDVKSFAEKALPTLQQHLEQAKQLDQTLSSGTTAT